MNLSTATIRLDYVHEHDRIRAELEDARVQLGKLCGRIAAVACDTIPVPQEPGDIDDQLYVNIDQIVQQVAKLAQTAGWLAMLIR